ncbi:MAG: carboxypeptidase regulatory-like domain-containing protein [Candidatus Korobacteraceae bacterium]|jgi:hypothetical protein
MRLVILICILLPIAALGQSTTAGAIGGTVRDQSKAVVANAKVTVQNLGTKEKKTGTTDTFGKFRIIALPPGQYDVTIEAPSFAIHKYSGLIVEVGRVTELEAGLKLGSVVETMQVSGDAPAVNTLQPDFATNINQEAINNLPINGRRWSRFALLAPGATPDGTFGLISFRGISGLLNNHTVDGGDNNQAFFSEERGRTRAAYAISQAAVREFQVNISNFSAEYGRAAGGVINTVTKSGSNKLHGEGFYFMRDNALGAINPLSTIYVPSPGGGYLPVPYKAEDLRQQFGGNLGGAIKQDKLFFFVNYEGQRRDFPGVGIPSTPGFLGPASSSELSALATNIHVNPTNPMLQTYFNQGLAFLQAETGPVPRRADQDTFFPKLDWIINRKHTFIASYNRLRWDSPGGVQTQPTNADGITSFGNDYVRTDMVMARLTSTLTSTLLNEFRYQWGRDFEFARSQAPSAAEQNPCAVMGIVGEPCPTLVTSFLTPGQPRAPQIYFSGDAFAMGRPYILERYAYPNETRNQFADIMSWMHGHHLLKFGFDLIRNNDVYNNLYEGGGEYVYGNRISFISDLISSMYGFTTPPTNYSSYYQSFGASGVEYHTWDYAGFIQDDWKLTRRLTLNFGLRYEYEKLPAPQFANPAVWQTGHVPSDKNNFGPRIGFAWDVFGNGKTAVRGGYGLYYGRINNGMLGAAMLETGAPGSQINYVISTRYTPACAPQFPAVLTSAPACGKPNIAYLSPNLQNPQIHQIDLIVEREIARNTVASISYLGTFGRELPNFIDTNLDPASVVNITYRFNGGTPLPTVSSLTVPVYTARLNNAFGSMMAATSNVNSSYNAMVVQLNRRMSHGLQVMMSYTWSHALDNGQNSQTLAPITPTRSVYDPYRRLDYGSSDYDIRQRLVASIVWQPRYFRDSSPLRRRLLDGWSLAPVVQVSTGKPYSEYISGDIYTYAAAASGIPVLDGGLNNAGGSRLATIFSRNSFRYPMLINLDLRLSRSFRITERQRVQVMAEAFNLLNHTQVTGLSTTMYYMGYPSNPYPLSPTLTYQTASGGYSGFGQITQAGSDLYRERQVQFGVKYSF